MQKKTENPFLCKLGPTTLMPLSGASLGAIVVPCSVNFKRSSTGSRPPLPTLASYGKSVILEVT